MPSAMCHVCSGAFKLCFLPRFVAFERLASRILQPQTARFQKQPLIWQSNAKPCNCSLINLPTHPLLSPSYPLWQGVSLLAFELQKLGQTTPSRTSWSRPRRRSSPRREVSTEVDEPPKSIIQNLYFYMLLSLFRIGNTYSSC